MKKILLIMLIGVFIMLKPINKIIDNSIGNIIHRGNVVTGIIDVVHANKSYDVFISESDRAYPKIFTLSANPDLAVGDKVRILYKDGCKELPIILPPITPAIVRYHAFIVHYGKTVGGIWKNFMALYDTDGILIKELEFDYGFGTYDAVTMDKWGNIYDCQGGDNIRKYDKELNLLLTVPREDPTYWHYTVNMGPDGYLYVLTADASWMRVQKRRTSDLAIVDTCILDSYYDGLCITADGHFFTICDWGVNEDNLLKIRFSDGTIVAQKYLEDIEHNLAGLGVIENNVYGAGGGIVEIGGLRADGLYIDTDLSGDFHAWIVGTSTYNYRVTAMDGIYMIASGWNGGSVIRKYDGDRNIIWEKILAGGGGNPFSIGAYNFAD